MRVSSRKESSDVFTFMQRQSQGKEDPSSDGYERWLAPSEIAEAITATAREGERRAVVSGLALNPGLSSMHAAAQTSRDVSCSKSVSGCTEARHAPPLQLDMASPEMEA